MKVMATIIGRSELRTASVLALIAFGSIGHVKAADLTWDGGGNDNNWSTPANWGGTAPAAGDSLFFGGSIRLNPANNYPAGTAFNGLTFNNPSASFTLSGNAITLGTDIADNMPLVPQTLNLPLFLNATRGVSVVADGSLTLGGIISGSAGAGITKIGSGLLILGAANTFSGRITISNGMLSIASDGNLGATPAAPTPGNIVINGGALRSTANLTLNVNRGIALGDSSPNGTGTLTVSSGTTLTYNGVIANNGGGGGLTKNSFGGLTLSGPNTYTGATLVKNGTVTLDFTQAGSPVNNVISSSSSLTLGGENAGLGTLSFAAVTLNGKTATANSQSFNGTTIDIGPAIIRANSAGAGVTLALGALTHNPGGVLNVVTPTATGGSGNITTLTPNTHGILGGWATVGDGSAPVGNIIIGTNWASVAGGNIVPYAGYTDYTSGNLHGLVSAATNLRFTGASHPGGAALAVRVNSEGAGTLTDINTIALQNVVNNDTLIIGAGNTLRLGRYGAIFRQESTITAGLFFGGSSGPQSGNGASGSQDVGTLTAGGADNTPGEIVFVVNAPSQTASGNQFIVEPKITDNGSGPVTVVKAGPGSMKLDGHNTFSGGLYILQGRLQFAGNETGVGGGPVGTANPDGGGTGRIYVMPGGQLYPSGANGAITNEMFIAGLGGSSFSSGAIRISSNPQDLAGQINLAGDVMVCGGGNGNTNGRISGKITGNFSFGVGQSGGGENIVTYFRLFNQNNDYSGDTVIGVRSGGTPASTLLLGASDVIPDGIGKGNLVLRPGSGAAATLDMFGFNETINGLTVPTANPQNALIQNSAAGTTSILTVGNYDASSTFAGIIRDSGGVVALTKIGRGRQTLTGANSYTGPTIINNGTLALSGSGSISASQHIQVDGGTLDTSDLTSFTHAYPVDVTNGTVVIRNTSPPGISSLSLANARLRIAGLGSVSTIAQVGSLGTDGVSNVIDIASVATISSYPAQFTLIKYASGIGGVGFNFQLGDVPTPSTVGYISNNVDNSSVDLVLLDGPKPLTWTGLNGTAWDINTTVNWRAFGVTPSVYLDVDSVRFDDGGAGNTVSLATTLLPGAVVVDNTLRDYTFEGSGKISGPAGLTKQGSRTLILNNTGTNDFFGRTIIEAGTVQVGNNNAQGNLSGGSISNNGALVFARTDNITVANAISGAGSVAHNGAGVLTLSGDSSFSGPATVSQATLRAGSSAAFGDGTGTTTVASGATLDINGQNLTSEPIIVSGAGVGNLGALINTGTGQNDALRRVTLAGDTTFGGTNRWDIRNSGGVASLNTGGNLFNITKTGPGQVSLVSVAVDQSLANIDVREGLFRLEDDTSQVGDPFATLSVLNNATLALNNLSLNPLNKLISLEGGATLLSEDSRSVVAGQISLLGIARINVATAGTTPQLVLNGALDGPGGFVKVGGGQLVLNNLHFYGGSTVISNGTLFVEGQIVASSGVTVYGGTLAGVGTIAPPIVVAAGGTLSPGDSATALATLSAGGSVSLAGTTIMDVNKAGGFITSDSVAGSDSVTYGGTLRINLTGEPLAEGDSLSLFAFNSFGGSFSSIVPGPGDGLEWDKTQLTVDGTLRVAAVRRPSVSRVTTSGSNLSISGTNGPANATYRVLSSTDVAQPLNGWQPYATNVFDSNGNFNFAAPIELSAPQRFFILVLP